MNGSLAAGSTVNVGTAGSLEGTGTINGNATLTGNGIISLGSVSGSTGHIVGTLTATGGNWNGLGNVGNVIVNSGTFSLGANASLTTSGTITVNDPATIAGAASSTINGSINYVSSAASTFAGTLLGSGSVTVNTVGASVPYNAYEFFNINGGPANPVRKHALHGHDARQQRHLDVEQRFVDQRGRNQHRRLGCFAGRGAHLEPGHRPRSGAAPRALSRRCRRWCSRISQVLSTSMA